MAGVFRSSVQLDSTILLSTLQIDLQRSSLPVTLSMFAAVCADRFSITPTAKFCTGVYRHDWQSFQQKDYASLWQMNRFSHQGCQTGNSLIGRLCFWLQCTLCDRLSGTGADPFQHGLAFFGRSWHERQKMQNPVQSIARFSASGA